MLERRVIADEKPHPVKDRQGDRIDAGIGPLCEQLQDGGRYADFPVLVIDVKAEIPLRINPRAQRLAIPVPFAPQPARAAIAGQEITMTNQGAGLAIGLNLAAPMRSEEERRARAKRDPGL